MSFKQEILNAAKRVREAFYNDEVQIPTAEALETLSNYHDNIIEEITPTVEEATEAKFNELVSSGGGGDVKIEVIDARKGEVSLGNKIDKIDESLDSKLIAGSSWLEFGNTFEGGTMLENRANIVNITPRVGNGLLTSKRDILFSGKAKLQANSTVVTTTNNLTTDYDEFEIQYHIYSSDGSRKSMPSAKICGNQRFEGTQLTFLGNDRSVVGVAWVQIGDGPSLTIWCPAVSYTTDSSSWTKYYFITRVIGIKY